jgi:ornithine decarboxylase
VRNFPGDVLFAVKANSSPWMLDAIWAGGVRGFDVASERELEMTSQRFPTAQLAFMHPVKSRKAIARAYFDFGVRTFVLDHEEELAKILAETNHADDLTLVVRLAVSNDGASLPLTGKFGASAQQAPALLRAARRHAAKLGVSFHVGSQCLRPVTYRAAMRDTGRLIVTAGVTVDVVDVGGGFPAAYPGREPPALVHYIAAIKAAWDDMPVLRNAELWCEPGRALCAEAGALLVRVELRKGDRLYLNDGAYGSLFDATHADWRYPVRLVRPSGRAAERLVPFTTYGPTCDSIDQGRHTILLPEDAREGDYIEFGMLGAYGVAMQTRFNGFGQTLDVEVRDEPWASLYAPAATPARRPRDLNVKR